MADDLGRTLDAKPEGEFTVRLMAVEDMVQAGMNVNRLHEEVDPTELIDFSGCRSWEDALRVGREAAAALEHMRADGWTVDARTWCNEAEHLLAGRSIQSPRCNSSFTIHRMVHPTHPPR